MVVRNQLQFYIFCFSLKQKQKTRVQPHSHCSVLSRTMKESHIYLFSPSNISFGVNCLGCLLLFYFFLPLLLPPSSPSPSSLPSSPLPPPFLFFLLPPPLLFPSSSPSFSSPPPSFSDVNFESNIFQGVNGRMWKETLQLSRTQGTFALGAGVRSHLLLKHVQQQ